jgi:hypothetical protein
MIFVALFLYSFALAECSWKYFLLNFFHEKKHEMTSCFPNILNLLSVTGMWKVYKTNLCSDMGKFSHSIQNSLADSLTSNRIKDTFQVNIPTTNPGWKMYVAQQHRLLSSHPNSKREFVSEKERIFRCRIEFEFIFHQTRIEFQIRPSGFFGIKLFLCVSKFVGVKRFSIEGTMLSKLLLL